MQRVELIVVLVLQRLICCTATGRERFLAARLTLAWWRSVRWQSLRMDVERGLNSDAFLGWVGWQYDAHGSKHVTNISQAGGQALTVHSNLFRMFSEQKLCLRYLQSTYLDFAECTL